MTTTNGQSSASFLAGEAVDALIQTIRKRGYEIIGPKVADAAIVFDTIDSAADLPSGISDSQDKSTYRLHKEGGRLLFGYAVGPQSLKRFFSPTGVPIHIFHRKNNDIHLHTEEREQTKRAFFGVRPCDVHALQCYERVALETPATYTYRANRTRSLIVAVNCTRPARTCFCVSMDTGPELHDGADIIMTETTSSEDHGFVITTHSAEGYEVLTSLQLRDATEREIASAQEELHAAKDSMKRTIETEGIESWLPFRHDHARWRETGERCFACGNCTMVCPTCFCSTIDDTTDLSGETAFRTRHWDSCFMLSHSYIHGGSVRFSRAARYRQWLTHKFAAWIEQFGTSGCVGCGRCITWCPAGIDVTEEIVALQSRTVPTQSLNEEVTHGN